MNMEEFVQNIADLYSDADTSAFSPDTKFKEIAEWSSLMALSVVAMIEDEYGIRIKGDDVRNSETISDLFGSVMTRKN